MFGKRKVRRIDHGLLGQLCHQLGVCRDDGRRMDAGETALLAKQLEFVIATMYETQYSPALARTFIPVNNSVPTGAQSYTYRLFDSFGMAEIIHSYADDLPMVGRLATEVNAPIRSIGDGFGYSVQDLRSAAFAGVPLASDLARVALQAVEQKIDELAATGSADDGLDGFVNNANFTDVSASVTGGWPAAAASVILADMNEVVWSVWETTNQLYNADTLLLPLEGFRLVSTVPFSTTTNATILDVFKQNNPRVSVFAWWRLDGAGGGSVDRMMAYARTPEVVELIIPQEFEQFPPQPKNLGFTIPCHARVGGIKTVYPIAAAFADGIE